jgi:hypothetical protein
MIVFVVSLITIVDCWLMTKIPSYAAFVFPFCVITSRVYTPAGRFVNEKAFAVCKVVEGTRSINWSDTVLTFASITSRELSLTNI